MSYLVLARKYRPKAFEEVVGQDVATRVLQGAIREERIAHAYLLCGPRGTGKTTTARILAKALNCAEGPTPTPCGTCERCRAAEEGSEVDIIEIDAASNRQIDDVRNLRDEVAYAPMRARFKVYVIDEVHMLTGPAFNALLKTLEEPPPHVKFLFATTDPHKVPDTVLSRCQVLHLSLLSPELIAGRLDEILELESVQAGPGVAAELARLARGSMRDALSATDQLLSLVGSEATVEDVRRLAGGDDARRAEEVLVAACAGEAAAALAALPPEEGSEPELVDAILQRLRAGLLAAYVAADDAGATGSGTDALAGTLREAGADRLQAWIEDLLAARERMRVLPQHGRLVLETTIAELSRPETGLALADLEARLVALETRLAGSAAAAPAAPARRRDEPQERFAARARHDAGAESRPAPPSEDPPTAPRPAAPEQPTRRRTTRGAKDTWEAFLAELRGTRGSLADVLAKRGEMVDLGEERVRIRLTRMADKDRPLVRDPANQQACDQVFSRVAGRAVTVILEDSAGQRPAQADTFTSHVANEFGGTVEEEA